MKLYKKIKTRNEADYVLKHFSEKKKGKLKVKDILIPDFEYEDLSFAPEAICVVLDTVGFQKPIYYTFDDVDLEEDLLSFFKKVFTESVDTKFELGLIEGLDEEYNVREEIDFGESLVFILKFVKRFFEIKTFIKPDIEIFENADLRNAFGKLEGDLFVIQIREYRK